MQKKMTGKSKVGSGKKAGVPIEYKTIANAMYEASRISFSLVFFPVILLLIGIKADKSLGTTPLFIILGAISGVVVGIYKATKIKREKLNL